MPSDDWLAISPGPRLGQANHLPVAERQLALGELIDDDPLPVEPSGSRCSIARVANAPSSFCTIRSTGRRRA